MLHVNLSFSKNPIFFTAILSILTLRKRFVSTFTPALLNACCLIHSSTWDAITLKKKSSDDITTSTQIEINDMGKTVINSKENNYWVKNKHQSFPRKQNPFENSKSLGK